MQKIMTKFQFIFSLFKVASQVILTCLDRELLLCSLFFKDKTLKIRLIFNDFSSRNLTRFYNYFRSFK
jgi:hypothetical protein